MNKAKTAGTRRSVASENVTVLTAKQKKAVARALAVVESAAYSTPDFLVELVEKAMASQPELAGVELGLVVGEYGGDYYILYLGPLDPSSPRALAEAMNLVNEMAEELELSELEKEDLAQPVLRRWVSASRGR